MKFKTPKEFDYDLFRGNDAQYFIRLKRTGEITEVSIEVFRLLRNEAQAIYRKNKGQPVYKKVNGKSKLVEYATQLSLNVSENEDNDGLFWLIDKQDTEEMLYVEMLQDEFKKELTELQCRTFEVCLLEGMSNTDFARLVGVHEATVRSSIRAIRKKFEKFYKKYHELKTNL